MNRRFLGGGHPRKKKSYLQMLDKVWDFCFCHCSVAQSCPTLCEFVDCSAPGFPVLHHLLELAQTHVFESVMPANHPILCRPLLLLPSISPASGSFLMSWLFASGGQSVGTSASISVLLMNIPDWFPLGLLVWSPCSPRDSQESFPILQFKSIWKFME